MTHITEVFLNTLMLIAYPPLLEGVPVQLPLWAIAVVSWTGKPIWFISKRHIITIFVNWDSLPATSNTLTLLMLA
jgi:hypothetical protein